MNKQRKSVPRHRRRVLIAGHGTAGTSLATDVTSNGDLVLGFLDDDAQGNEILGTLADVAEVCRRENVDVVYFAIPSAPPEAVRDFVMRVPRPEVELAIIPRTYRIVARDRVSVSDLTDVDVLDLVGRAPVKHDMMLAREFVAGRRVLVTGAAGSIGSRVVAQLLALDPAVVVCVDRSESGMFHLGNALSHPDRCILEIADVQVEQRIAQIMEQHKPELVFHIAAYKHVPLMQNAAVEAFNNNVWGTLNVLTQAAMHDVEHVIYVSTDKAVRPTNVMGATKRIGELLLREIGDDSATRFSGVRFGNVLESEGSVMQTFRRQLQAGRNLTVTHPDITRYFMTIDEAAQLVLQTATAGKQGETFVLDMGDPIRIIDLARGLITAVEPGLDIDVIGLRPGEKMYEELSYSESNIDPTLHPKIFVVRNEKHESESALPWVHEMLPRTRSYEITDAELREALRNFGFASLQ